MAATGVRATRGLISRCSAVESKGRILSIVYRIGRGVLFPGGKLGHSSMCDVPEVDVDLRCDAL